MYFIKWKQNTGESGNDYEIGIGNLSVAFSSICKPMPSHYSFSFASGVLRGRKGGGGRGEEMTCSFGWITRQSVYIMDFSLPAAPPLPSSPFLFPPGVAAHLSAISSDADTQISMFSPQRTNSQVGGERKVHGTSHTCS